MPANAVIGQSARVPLPAIARSRARARRRKPRLYLCNRRRPSRSSPRGPFGFSADPPAPRRSRHRDISARRNAHPAAFLIGITEETSRPPGSSTTPTGSGAGTEEVPRGNPNGYHGEGGTAAAEHRRIGLSTEFRYSRIHAVEESYTKPHAPSFQSVEIDGPARPATRNHDGIIVLALSS